MRFSGEFTKEQFAEHAQPLNERLTQLDESIPELLAEVDFLSIQMVSSDVVLDEAKELSNEWQNMSFKKKWAMVETITDSVTVGKEDMNIALCLGQINILFLDG